MFCIQHDASTSQNVQHAASLQGKRDVLPPMQSSLSTAGFVHQPAYGSSPVTVQQSAGVSQVGPFTTHYYPPVNTIQPPKHYPAGV